MIMATEDFLEIEKRYKVYDVKACLAACKDLGLVVQRTSHLIDEWYLPEHIRSLEEEKKWFDVDHGLAWRIRRSDQNGSHESLEVTSKQLTEDSNHNTFQETTEVFDSYNSAVESLRMRDYKNWLTIDKTRYLLSSANPDISNEEFEIVIDEIAGLADKIGIGACLEIEHKGAHSRQDALKKIAAIAKLLGFSDDDSYEQSLTVVSMTELARF
jgi:adenylate cyclase class IV